MALLQNLERRFGWFAVPRLTLALVIAQVVTYGVCFGIDHQPGRDPDEPAAAVLELVPQKVLEGEVWRLGTFLLMPPAAWPFFAICFWYFFWMMGSALEAHWGNFRYTFFLGLGYLATVAASFLTPSQPSSNLFLESTVFLAFAFLNPEFPILLFFLIAVPIKWFARVTWAGILFAILLGPWEVKAQAIAAVANFLMFFARDIVHAVRTGQRRMQRKAQEFAAEGRKPAYFHKCTICGITDRSHAEVSFRYCSKCAGQMCYCEAHLKNHDHAGKV